MKIEHLKPLTENKLFKFLTITQVVLGLILGSIVLFPMSICLTPTGYENFLKVGTLPFAVISLAIPLGGFYGLLHKSKQIYHLELDAKLKQQSDKYSSHFDSVDALLVLLYRITNHAEVLKGWLLKEQRNADQIRDKHMFILDNWASFYTEQRFMPAMRYLTGSFNNLDSIMSGFEKGVVDILELDEVVFPKKALDNITAELSKLEEQVLKHREDKNEEFQIIAREIYAQYGITILEKTETYSVAELDTRSSLCKSLL